MANIRQEKRGYGDRSLFPRYQKEKTPAKEMARVGAAFTEIAQQAVQLNLKGLLGIAKRRSSCRSSQSFRGGVPPPLWSNLCQP
jgi:hypothetical protein